MISAVHTKELNTKLHSLWFCENRSLQQKLFVCLSSDSVGFKTTMFTAARHKFTNLTIGPETPHDSCDIEKTITPGRVVNHVELLHIMSEDKTQM